MIDVNDVMGGYLGFLILAGSREKQVFILPFTFSHAEFPTTFRHFFFPARSFPQCAGKACKQRQTCHQPVGLIGYTPCVACIYARYWRVVICAGQQLGNGRASNLSETSTAIKPSKPQGRSRIGNGRAILPDVDGRSATMRRYKEILGQLITDMGGDPSEAMTIIARRASTLAVWCEQAEADMANGNNIDIGEFTTATNALRRLLADIGLERKARDITPTLDSYLRNKGRAA